MKAQGIMHPFSHLMKAGFSRAVAQQLTSGRVAVLKLAHLEKLCLLLQCRPHDVLVWRPDEGQTAEVPLGELQEKEDGLDFLATLQGMPVDKLREIGERLREMK